MKCLQAVCYLAASYLCTVEKFRQDLLLSKQESRVGTKVFLCLSTPLGFFFNKYLLFKKTVSDIKKMGRK